MVQRVFQRNYAGTVAARIDRELADGITAAVAHRRRVSAAAVRRRRRGRCSRPVVVFRVVK